MILIIPLPQILQMMTTKIATRAMGQLVEQLFRAEGARIRPMEMMIGPVTTGGKKVITFLDPTDLQISARTRYTSPAQATPRHA